MFTIRMLFITVASIAAGAMTASAFQAAEAPEETPEETAEQVTARALCTETAEHGAYPEWMLNEGKTCENSFDETCTVTRKSDKLQVAYACYAPLPQLEDAEVDGE
ncbi:hypothetical protein PUV54_14240 [Hyphococcus flavus]|uniref:Uncharacterized protein n=1 Tax=Hyphococcus flavus TaxID=1866326 RepID=A0AAE9ZBL5_9PROT|nr:hypothetical protein [Hyphococcus flavus]WDI31111.1 hypothetical protein PUV54_14240 [Hyphococcus flavus]